MPGKLLVVEDEAVMRRTIVKELTEAGHQTIEATDGHDGLLKISRFRPDIVITDVAMPGMDGFEMLRRFRNEHPEMAATPIIFVTAYDERAKVLEARRGGADDYLTKPIDFELLLAIVDNHLHRARQVKEWRDRDLVKLYTRLATGGVESATPATPPQTAAPSSDRGDKASPSAGAAPGSGTDTAQRGAPSIDALGLEPGKSRKVVGGRVAMIGLNDIKDELGADWEKFAARIQLIAENEISRSLSNRDTYWTEGLEHFEICFHDTSEAEAERLTQEIKQRIRDAIIAAQMQGAFGELLTSPEALHRTANLAAQVHEVEIAANEIGEDVDIGALISKKITDAAEQLDRNAQKILLDVHQNAEAALRPIQAVGGALTNFLIVDFDAGHQRKVNKIKNALDGKPDLMYELDVLRLGMACNYIVEHTDGQSSYVLVRVNYSTLVDRKFSLKYFSICNKISDFIRKSLIFVIENIPDTCSNSQFKDVTRSVKPFCLKSFVQIARPDLGSISLRESGIPSVVMNYHDLKAAVARNHNDLVAFFENLQAIGANVLVDEVSERDELENLRALPIKYYSISEA